jgi:hypothetical protein
MISLVRVDEKNLYKWLCLICLMLINFIIFFSFVGSNV